MEMKKPRVAALCIMLLLVLPSEQRQQVAAMSKFYNCFNACYPGCRNHAPRWACILFCANKCSPNTNQVGDGVDSTAATCRMACKIHICDSSAASTDAADAPVCMQNSQLTIAYYIEGQSPRGADIWKKLRLTNLSISATGT